MKNLRATVAVGLVTVVSVVLVMVAVMHSNRGIGSGDDTYVLRALFDDVTGIAKGTKVTIAGFTVGQVDDVQLVGAEVQVKLRLKDFVKVYNGVPDPRTGELRNAAVLSRAQASLLGDYYLELAPGAAGRVLKEGDFIPNVVTASALQSTLEKLETASTIVPKIDKIAGDVGKITETAAKAFGTEAGARRFEEMAENLVQASRNLSATTASLQDRLGEGVLAPGGDLDKGLRSFARIGARLDRMTMDADALLTSGGASARRSLENVEVTTRAVRDLVGRHTEGVDSTVGTITSTLRKLEESLGRVDRVLAQVEASAAHVAQGKGTVGRLLHDETLIRKAEEAMRAATAVVDKYAALEIGIDYKLAGYGRQWREQGVTLAGTEPRLEWQSHLGLRLQPRDDMFVAATLTSDNVGRSTTKTRITRTTVGDTAGPPLTETFVEHENEWKWGLVYARRFGWLTLRGGVIESTAGGGVDVAMLGKKLTVSGDLFRFTEETRPRLRVSALWNIWRPVNFWVGGDELLLLGRADWFAGLGISFTDDDLKLLFAAAPNISTN